MAVIENIKADLSDLTALKMVTGAFSDISALKITSLRKAFEQNTFYYEQISQLYQSVRLSAYMQKYLKYNKKQKLDTRPNTIHVAITSNHRFYGTINRDIMERFISESKNPNEDRMIIGMTGRDFANSHPEIGPYNCIIFQQDDPPKTEKDAFLKLTKPYDRVFIYYPKFLNMLTQSPDRVDIAYAPKDITGGQHTIKYIFEPELPKILNFFELQIRGLLFARVVLETELSRTATRLFAMDTAERHASDLIKNTKSELRRAKQGLLNRRLLETFSSIAHHES